MNGSKNTHKLVTNQEGKASFALENLTTGNYTIEFLFKGNNEFKPSNSTSTLEIKEKVIQQSYSDPHPDWVCEGDTWYSVKIGEGDYALYDKESGKMIGTGDMPDRHGYHGEEYVKQYSSSVKYRSNGEYYD